MRCARARRTLFGMVRRTRTSDESSASGSIDVPKARPATSFAPRPLTPSELAWLLREGREFAALYAGIRAAIVDGEQAERARGTRR